MSPRLARGTIPQLLRSPSRLLRAVPAAMALAPRGWWRRPPFLPLPDERYWTFRLETSAGGEGDVPPSPHEVAEVVDWAKRMRRARR
jgi:hypothetical protein